MNSNQKKSQVTSENEIKAAFETLRENFGRVDVIVNCAGILIPGKLYDTVKKEMQSLKEIEDTVNVNVIGTMNVIQFACQMMAENEKDKDGQRGVIINVSSICAYDDNSLHAYSASKGAISSMTSPLAFEFARHGIRFMAIAPGIFSTPMIANLNLNNSETESIMLNPKRFGNPVEFAALVHHIIENRYLNGEVIRLDGGLRLQQ